MEHGYDVLDLHYYFRSQIHHRVKDGVHWNFKAHRRITNFLLTHISEAWAVPLPNRNKNYIEMMQEEEKNAAVDANNNILDHEGPLPQPLMEVKVDPKQNEFSQRYGGPINPPDYMKQRSLSVDAVRQRSVTVDPSMMAGTGALNQPLSAPQFPDLATVVAQQNAEQKVAAQLNPQQRALLQLNTERASAVLNAQRAAAQLDAQRAAAQRNAQRRAQIHASQLRAQQCVAQQQWKPYPNQPYVPPPQQRRMAHQRHLPYNPQANHSNPKRKMATQGRSVYWNNGW